MKNRHIRLKQLFSTMKQDRRNLFMETSHRSGGDRRLKIQLVGDDRRQGNDRRNIIDRIEQYSRILKKIPVFRDLSVDHLKQILSIASHRSFNEDETLCTAGEESVEIFILITGLLQVALADGSKVAKVKPLGIVGEMGILTGNPRSATVVAAESSLVVSIRKTELMRLIKTNHDICRILLLNVIKELSDKLCNINDMFDRLKQIHVIE